MLSDRIIGALTFRKGVYTEVEQDTSFTQTAWILVVVVTFLNQLGAHASSNGLNWIVGTLLGTVGTVISIAIGAYLISRVGRSLFSADVSLDEVVRTMGLAYIWNVVGVLGVLSVFSVGLSGLARPIIALSTFVLLIAWFIAAKEALDLNWNQTITTVVLAMFVLIAFQVIVGLILRVLGFAAGALGGMIFG